MYYIYIYIYIHTYMYIYIYIYIYIYVCVYIYNILTSSAFFVAKYIIITRYLSKISDISNFQNLQRTVSIKRCKEVCAIRVILR